MKPGTKDNAEGKMHQVKCSIKETIGNVVGNCGHCTLPRYLETNRAFVR